jgi:hypothetical protein
MIDKQSATIVSCCYIARAIEPCPPRLDTIDAVEMEPFNYILWHTIMRDSRPKSGRLGYQSCKPAALGRFVVEFRLHRTTI